MATLNPCAIVKAATFNSNCRIRGLLTGIESWLDKTVPQQGRRIPGNRDFWTSLGENVRTTDKIIPPLDKLIPGCCDFQRLVDKTVRIPDKTVRLLVKTV